MNYDLEEQVVDRVIELIRLYFDKYTYKDNKIIFRSIHFPDRENWFGDIHVEYHENESFSIKHIYRDHGDDSNTIRCLIDTNYKELKFLEPKLIKLFDVLDKLNEPRYNLDIQKKQKYQLERFLKDTTI